MQHVIVIQVCRTYQNQELTKVIHLGPLVSTILDHYYEAYKQLLFYVTTNDKTEMFKCYVILYTCTITTGIILDLVKDGYTETSIAYKHLLLDENVPKISYPVMGKYLQQVRCQHFVQTKVYRGASI